MRLGYWAADNVNNVYCGKDGGTSYRHPLLHELNQRGHTIWFNGPDPGNYEYTEDALKELDILTDSYRFRESLGFLINDRARGVTWAKGDGVAHLDACIVELRSKEFDEFDRMRNVIDRCLEHDVAVFGFDRNNWGHHLNVGRQEQIELLRPYYLGRPSWKEDHFFPYPYAPNYWPDSNTDPAYDLVYVGNRYGREDEMDDFLSGLDMDILVAGNWPNRDQSVTDTYDHVDFVGSTPHFSTIPFIRLGRMTFHVGKHDYHNIGMFTPRLVEAALANRVCAISADHDYTEWVPDQFLVHDNDDVRSLLDNALDPAVVETYKHNLWTQTVTEAATQLELCIKSA